MWAVGVILFTLFANEIDMFDNWPGFKRTPSAVKHYFKNKEAWYL